MSTQPYYQPALGKAWRYSLDGASGAVTELAPSPVAPEAPVRFDLDAPPKRQTRESAFGYVSMPKGAVEATFAQCASCQHMTDDGRCLLFRPSDKVVPAGACNLYQYGTPVSAADVTDDCFSGGKPKDYGYVVAAVRCGNCTSYHQKSTHGECELMEQLNKAQPHYWDLKEHVRACDCCNAWTGPTGDARLSLGALHMGGLHGDLAEGRPDSDFDPGQLKKGQEVEREHTSDPNTAKQIAKDHLVEKPTYYDELEKMEGRAEVTLGVYIFRHGKTKLNTDGESPDLIRGWLDVPLDEKGKEQAEKLGPLGKALDVKKVYCSDLKRARATAGAVADEAGVTVEPTQALRPWNLGEFQGKSAADSAPELMHYATEAPGQNVPGGESFEDYCNRFLPFLKGVMDGFEKDGGNVALVTHYRNCKLTEAWVKDGCGLGLDGDTFFTDDLPTGAVLRLYRQGDRWQCDRVPVPGMRMSVRIRFADAQGEDGPPEHIVKHTDDLLKQVDDGGVPAMMTNRLKSLAGHWKVDVKPEHTPNDVIGQIRKAREAHKARAAESEQSSAHSARINKGDGSTGSPGTKVANDPTHLQKVMHDNPEGVDQKIREIGKNDPEVKEFVQQYDTHGGDLPPAAQAAAKEIGPSVVAKLVGQEPPAEAGGGAGQPPDVPSEAAPAAQPPGGGKRPAAKSYKTPSGQKTVPGVFTSPQQAAKTEASPPAPPVPSAAEPEKPPLDDAMSSEQAFLPNLGLEPGEGAAGQSDLDESMEAAAAEGGLPRPERGTSRTKTSPTYLHQMKVGSTVNFRTKGGKVVRGRVIKHFGDPLTPGSNMTEILPTLGGEPIRVPSDSLASQAAEAGGPAEQPAPQPAVKGGKEFEAFPAKRIGDAPLPKSGAEEAAGALGRVTEPEAKEAAKPPRPGPESMEIPGGAEVRHKEVEDLAKKYGVGRDAEGKPYDRPLDDEARTDLGRAMGLPGGAKVVGVTSADSPLEKGGKVPVGIQVEHGGKKYVYQLEGPQAHKLVEVGPSSSGEVHEPGALPGKGPTTPSARPGSAGPGVARGELDAEVVAAAKKALGKGFRILGSHAEAPDHLIVEDADGNRYTHSHHHPGELISTTHAGPEGHQVAYQAGQFEDGRLKKGERGQLYTAGDVSRRKKEAAEKASAAAIHATAEKQAGDILKEAATKASPKVKEEAEEARKKGEKHLEGMAKDKGWNHTLKVLGLILGGYVALRALRHHPGGLGLMLALAGLYFWAKKNADEKKDGKEAGSDEDAEKDGENLLNKGMNKDGDPAIELGDKPGGEPRGPRPPKNPHEGVERAAREALNKAEAESKAATAKERKAEGVAAANKVWEEYYKTGEALPAGPAPSAGTKPPGEKLPEVGEDEPESHPKEGVATPAERPVATPAATPAAPDTQPAEPPAPKPVATPAENPAPGKSKGGVTTLQEKGKATQLDPAHGDVRPLHELNPDEAREEFWRLDALSHKGDLPDALKARYAATKYLASANLKLSPAQAAREATQAAIAGGARADTASVIGALVNKYVQAHGHGPLNESLRQHANSSPEEEDQAIDEYHRRMAGRAWERDEGGKGEEQPHSPEEAASEAAANLPAVIPPPREAGGAGKGRTLGEAMPHAIPKHWYGKYIAGIGLGDSPEEASELAGRQAAADGEDEKTVRWVKDFVLNLARRIPRTGNGPPPVRPPGRRMSLDGLVALAWADFTGKGGTPSVANARRLARDVARLSLSHGPDEVLEKVGGHVTRLSLGGA